MVLTHVIDSWTHAAARETEAYYTLSFIGGIASPLFLFLAGVATAMSAAAKGRREGSHESGARLARRRGWEIFALGLIFRLQAQLLGLGPIENLFKVDMLNAMGLSIVGASLLWQWSPDRRRRIVAFAIATSAITMITPLVRDSIVLAGLPDPLEAYLRPVAPYTAFPLFPWAGFLFAGALVGDLIDATRRERRRQIALQSGLALAAAAGVTLGWLASFQPAIYPSASFWHDSPTFFFIRLGLVTLLVPCAWVVEHLAPGPFLRPLVTLGRSSLFVYWIHIEMVYGVIAEPLKGQMPLWMSLAATALMTIFLYRLVVLKNRWLQRHGLQGPLRVLAPVLR
jgi:uncharacterized membrane protein